VALCRKVLQVVVLVVAFEVLEVSHMLSLVRLCRDSVRLPLQCQDLTVVAQCPPEAAPDVPDPDCSR